MYKRQLDKIDAVVGGTSGKFGSGGMESKLAAAKMASWAGVTTTIAAATRLNVVADSLHQVGDLGLLSAQSQTPYQLESCGSLLRFKRRDSLL